MWANEPAHSTCPTCGEPPFETVGASDRHGCLLECVDGHLYVFIYESGETYALPPADGV